MGHGVPMESGYNHIVQQKAIAWLLSREDVLQMMDEYLKTLDPHQVGQMLKGSGAENVAKAVLNVYIDLNDHKWKVRGQFFSTLEGLAKADPYLAFTEFVLNPRKEVLQAIGQTVQERPWWKTNAKAVRKAQRDLATVKEVQES